MSWQLAVWIGLGVVILGGFVWFERSRPPARVVALVAALAALAVAGRLVLAPIPNVVATTDIALITGFALGAAPGFAVGALAAPVSNIWLGQGPWTAWEMAGWGLVGLAGAALAVATGRRLGRVGLAVACGVAGLAYGALLDLSVMVTYGGEQSLDRYLALSARGIPFNVAHALGNVAIALAAGPALVRMISRYQTRLTFTWRPAPATLVLGLLAIVLLPALAPAPARASDVTDARAYLVRSQNDDGGFAAARGGPSNPAMTAWVMLGLEAAGRNPLDVRQGGETPVSYLRSELDRVRSATDLERTILALEAAGVDSRGFAGKDLVGQLRDYRDRDGSVDGQVNITAFWVVAMRAAGVDGGDLGRSARWLREAQNSNGGWGFRPDAPSDPDSTGAALQALGAAGSAGGDSGSDGVSYLRRSQHRSGGWALATSGAVNTQSTAWAVQGLLAAGAGGEPLDRGLAHIAARRAADGHYRYSTSSDQTPVWVTAQAVMAAAKQALPLEPVPRAPKPEDDGDDGDGTGSGTSSPGGTTSPFPTTPAPAPSFGGGGGAGFGSLRGGGSPTPTPTPGPGSAPTLGPDAGAIPGTEAARNESPAERAARQVAAGTFSAAPAATEEPVPQGWLSEDAELYLLGGLGGLAASLAGGFFWYRKRLP